MYSTCEPKIRYEHEKNVTINDLVQEADQIWSKICAAGEPIPRKMADISARNYEKCDALLTTLCREHKEFNKVYAIILKCAVHNGMYNSGVFRRWVEKIQDDPWKSEEQWIEKMTEYLVSLYKNCFPRECAGKRSAIMSKNIHDLLKGEHEAIKKASIDAEKSVNEMEEKLEKKRIEELVNFIRAVGETGIDAATKTRLDVDQSLRSFSAEMPEEKFVLDFGDTVEDLLD